MMWTCIQYLEDSHHVFGILSIFIPKDYLQKRRRTVKSSSFWLMKKTLESRKKEIVRNRPNSVAEIPTNLLLRKK